MLLVLEATYYIGLNFKSYLTNRRQRVKVQRTVSNWSLLNSGVPQGSVLGPILFLIYTFDFPSKSRFSLSPLDDNTFISSYADDTKYYSEAHLHDNCLSLQQSLSSLLNWSKNNYMPINMSKCQVLHLGKRASQEFKFKYSLDTYLIDETPLMKDMGVWIDKNVSFTDHIAKITLDANRILGVIKSTFICITSDIFKIVYKSLIRPKLEYACQVWSPFQKKNIQKLENIQRRATKCVRGMKHRPYRERLRLLGLTCLEIRRKRGDLIIMWKYLNGLCNINFKLPNLFKNSCVSRRGNSLRVSPPTFKPPKTKIRTYFFTERIVNMWNSLPDDIVNTGSISLFKGRLDSHWKDPKNLPSCSCFKPDGFCIPLP